MTIFFRRARYVVLIYTPKEAHSRIFFRDRGVSIRATNAGKKKALLGAAGGKLQLVVVMNNSCTVHTPASHTTARNLVPDFRPKLRGRGLA